LVDYFWKNVLTWYNYYRKYRVFDRVSINWICINMQHWQKLSCMWYQKRIYQMSALMECSFNEYIRALT
jgi:hypothetical protein